ncbi:helix-turn-helix transcriptional regulator [Stappia sp. P2PMeth1]|uniref:S24 family peptidase n=1 Tax=Stappia sp. P2PMeth1 TaxID=2003586 RepID=UPI00164622A4|nr:helix-turn-helix transcriptional regulator [Stappia sp. P2PMeth1]
MLSHETLWSAIDLLARRNGLTPSGLARRAGLDPTTFNPSKRTAADGRPRWPSMESIAKILGATRSDLADFVALVNGPDPEHTPVGMADDDRLPLPRGTAQAGGLPAVNGFFHDGDLPAMLEGERQSSPSEIPCEDCAIRVTGDGMLPFYREGDVIVISPKRAIQRGDRVALRLASGELRARIFDRRLRGRIELSPLDAESAPERLVADEVVWMARIIWASQ